MVTDIPAFRALTGDGAIGRIWPPGDAVRLAEALVDTASNRPSPGQVRGYFDANLSFAAIGRRWLDAYARVLDGHARGARRNLHWWSPAAWIGVARDACSRRYWRCWSDWRQSTRCTCTHCTRRGSPERKSCV